MTPRRIDLAIGELRVEGLPPGEARRLADAVQQALPRLLAAGDPAPRGGAADRVQAASVPAGGSPEALGARVAAALVRSLPR